MGMRKQLKKLIEKRYQKGDDGQGIVHALLTEGMQMMRDQNVFGPTNRIVANFEGDEVTDYHVVNLPTQVIEYTNVEQKLIDALYVCAFQFDYYRMQHLKKDTPEADFKAMVNHAMMKFIFSVTEDEPDYPTVLSPAYPLDTHVQAVIADFMGDVGPSALRPSGVAPLTLDETAFLADSSPVQPDSTVLTGGSAIALLKAVLAASQDGDPIKGISIHIDDQPMLPLLQELGYLARDDVSDDLIVTIKGKEALGVKPEGMPDLPVAVAEITGNIRESELVAQYIDAKISGVNKVLREKPEFTETYDIVGFVLTEIAHEFREGMHLPTVHIEGRIIPYNEDRTTGIVHADSLQTFFDDVFARNVKAGWWTNLATGEPKLRNVGELLMLFVTEIAEAYDAYVEDVADDKLPEHPGLGVELGDLAIRLADLCGALASGQVPAYSGVRNPGENCFREVVKIARQYESIRKTPEAIGDPELGLPMLPMVIGPMIDAKLAFNATRADHKIENRLKEDGKKT